MSGGEVPKVSAAEGSEARMGTSSPGRPAVGYVSVFIAGGLVVWLGLELGSYLIVGGGIATSLIAVYRLHDVFETVCVPRRCLPPAILGYVLGGALIVLGVGVGLGQFPLVGTWISAVALAALAASIGPWVRASPGHWAWAGGALAAVAIGVAAVVNVDEVLVAALLIGVVGVAFASLGVMELSQRNAESWVAAGVLALIGSLMGFEYWIQERPNLVMLLPVMLVGGIGMVAVSKGVPVLVRNWTRFRYATVFVGGLAVAAVVTVTFSRADWPLSWTIGIVVLSAVVCLALVTDVVELALVLLLGVAIAAVVTDRSDRMDLSPHPEAPRRIVALGDSYISGEGAANFFAGTSVAGVNECRRTSTAYPYLVADALDLDLDSYACSGARTRHVDLRPQQPNSPPDVAGGLPQLDALDVDDGDIAAVLVSIGGNDAWFGKIGQACIAPGSCEVHRTTVLKNVTAIGQDIGRVYEAIVAKVGRDVSIVAMPYPITATEQGCEGSPLTQSEHEFLFEFTEVLNDRARTEAARVGINWFAGGVSAFQGHRICDPDVGEPAMNVLNINPPEGELVDRLLPVNWVHGSAHPSEFGHERTAEALTEWLGAHLDAVENRRAPANPAPDTKADFEVTLPSPFKRVSTSTLGLPADLGCPVDELPISAVLTIPPLGGERSFGNLEPFSQVCFNRPDGSWSDWTTADHDGTASVKLWTTHLPDAANPPPPGASQVLITQVRDGDWRVSVLAYCELDPGCADDDTEIEAWMYSEVGNRASTAAAPALFIFIGTWFLALEWRKGKLQKRMAKGLRKHASGAA